MSSFVFLLGLFYTRYIPLSIFWGIYSCFFGDEETQENFFTKIFTVLLILFSYLISFLIITVLCLAILNYFFQDSSEGVAPILLFVSENWFFPSRPHFKNYFYSFLLNQIFCSPKKILAIKTICTFLEVLFLVLIMIGAIEVYNDFHSHLNPDIFDFLFPEGGAEFLWGGIALLSLTYFFLNFLIPGLSGHKWKKRLTLSTRFRPFIKELVISNSLFHPYFFLSPAGRAYLKENPKPEEELSLLLEKALIENKDRIPENWLKKL